MLFIGLDIGTSNIKSILVNEKSEILKVYSVKNTLVKDDENRFVFNANEIWDKVLFCLAKLIEEYSTYEILGISISSMVEAGVPLDKNDNILYYVMPWNDRRSEDEVNFLKSSKMALEIYSKTGQPIHTKYPLPKFLWLKNNKPEVFKKIKSWLSIGDFILYKLTGEKATDFTQATRTMFYNIIDRKWDGDLINLCEVKNIFPSVSKSGTFVGNIKKDVLSQIGLNSEVKVFLGSHDHLMALNGSGISKGEVLDSIGTSEVFTGKTNHILLNKENMEKGVAFGAFDDKEYYWMANLPSSGASIEWFIKMFFSNSKIDYNDILAMSDKNILNDIIYLPYINGRGVPNVSANTKGSLIGLSSSDTPKDILKAIYEGISFQTRLIFESLDYVNEINKIKIVGGGSKNSVWMDIKADILGYDLAVFDIEEMSAFSAAKVAAEYFGVFFKQAPSKIVNSEKKSSNDYYLKKYSKFKNLCEAMK